MKAFGEAGYQTHWFSNQSPFGRFDTSVAVYAREAQDVRFLNPSTFEYRSSLDGVLLDPLRSTLRMPGRHLIVLHTLGSHFDFALRYPRSFDRFNPTVAGGLLVDWAVTAAEQRVSDHYDNSILYTDFLLSEVISAVKSRGGRTIVAYFSDHGVDLPNGVCPYREAARSGVSAYRVPAVFWFSEAMQEEHLLEWRHLQENARAPYTTRAMYSTLLELGGVGIVGGLPAESFLRQTSVEENPRMIGVGATIVDFDQAKKRNACRISAP